MQKLASQYLKKEWPGVKAEERNDFRSLYPVWKSFLESTVQVAQSRINICENYKNLISEPARAVKGFKEQQLKKCVDQLIRIQMELQETVKDLAKGKKKYFETEQMAQTVREKADIEAKSKLSLFQSRISLQKASVKLKARRSECNAKATHARNEYLLTLAAANAHQDRYYQTDLVNIIKILWLTPRLEIHEKDRGLHCSLTNRIDLCLPCSSNRVVCVCVCMCFCVCVCLCLCVCLCCPCATFDIQSFSAVQLVDIEPSLVSALRVTLAEVYGVISPLTPCRGPLCHIIKLKAEARLDLLKQIGVSVDTWLKSAMNQVMEELENERWANLPAMASNGSSHLLNVDLEREEGEDGLDAFEDSNSSPSGTLRNYPLTCKVVYSYKVGVFGLLAGDRPSYQTGPKVLFGFTGSLKEGEPSGSQDIPTRWIPSPLTDSSPLLSLPVCFVKALYDYEGQTDDELSFPEGAIIRILNKENQDDDGFWEGEFNGHVGVFPSVLVEELTASENGEVACIAEVQVFPSAKSQNSLAPLPLYDQPPVSPFPSPDKRGAQGFSRSPSANVSENNFPSNSPGFSQPPRHLPESTSYGKLRPHQEVSLDQPQNDI
ncbi:F-BAR and double SH3 domains protein 2-like [Pseudonaja textilis]|uniref:F-BAR and double SH3 domains protein 2-like n=1 Tax=Pseudonaja textilis TaxID=8673 RepID=UPI000EAA1A98|nr:F-BAR and double SH3 domains protein 2-like [Pseudonaja textilis]